MVRKVHLGVVEKEDVLVFLRTLSRANLSGKEVMIMLLLYLFPRRFEAKAIGQLLRIPLKNLHRILSGLEKVGGISTIQEKPQRYVLSSKLRKKEI